MKILHTADLHFSIKEDKLTEVINCTAHMLDAIEDEKPDIIILAGDIVDEYDGKIRLDSETARAAITFVQQCGNIAPVVIIRGTKSHDREAPYIFQHLQAKHPIYVGTEIEQIALVEPLLDKPLFVPLDQVGDNKIIATFTLLPSVDKSYLYAQTGSDIASGNAELRELLHDVMSGFGVINNAIPSPIPRIMVAHGMMTGAQFSSGQTAIGEDLEFGINDLAAANCDYIAMGHVHMLQSFSHNGKVIAWYSGSPGRMNFGEREEKGFLMPEFNGREYTQHFHPTPARRFVFGEADWRSGGKEAVLTELGKCLADCKMADVRFRYSITEEDKNSISREDMEKQLIDAGATRVKVECQIIPKERQRAAGISKLTTLPEKVAKWGETIGQDIPQSVLDIAAVIEGKDVEELIDMAMKRIGQTPSTDDRQESIKGAMRDYVEKQEEDSVVVPAEEKEVEPVQPGLF